MRESEYMRGKQAPWWLRAHTYVIVRQRRTDSKLAVSVRQTNTVGTRMRKSGSAILAAILLMTGVAYAQAPAQGARPALPANYDTASSPLAIGHVPLAGRSAHTD